MENISIYRRRHDGKIALVGFVDHIDDLFKTCTRENIRHFAYSFAERFRGPVPFYWDRDYNQQFIYDCLHNFHFGYVAFDERDRLITPDRLVGMYRAYVRRTYRGIWFYYRHHPGRKRKNCHYYRHFRTLHERKWCDAWNDEDFAPPPRAKRNQRNLPKLWIDEIPRHLSTRNNNWKRYRKTQWKDKKGEDK